MSRRAGKEAAPAPVDLIPGPGSVPALGSLSTDPLPVVRVNPANLNEIKSALDEVLKKHLADESFTASLMHPLVHLSLGYSSVLISLAAVLYSLRVSFEDSKPVLWVGVVGYAVLQAALWAWKRWVEKGEVFRGKRRRMVKRIETDHIQIASSTSLYGPPAPLLTLSPHSRPSSPTSPLSSPSSSTLSSPTSSSPSVPTTSSFHPRVSSSSSSLSLSSTYSEKGPTYLVSINVSTTSNNGKSLIHKARLVAGRSVGELVDEQGGVEEGEVSRWIRGILGEAGVVVGEEEKGVKEE